MLEDKERIILQEKVFKAEIDLNNSFALYDFLWNKIKLKNIKSAYNSLDDSFPFFFESISIFMDHSFSLWLEGYFFLLADVILLLSDAPKVIGLGLVLFGFIWIEFVGRVLGIIIVFLFIVQVVFIILWLRQFVAVSELKVLVKFWTDLSFHPSEDLN